MKTFFLLIFEFFKTGLFAMGGGLATIPFLNEMSIKYGWFTSEMLSTMIAVSESTPGAIGINMSTYVGYILFKVPGAIASTFALVAPSIIVITIIANMMEKFQDSKTINYIFSGLKPAVIGLILAACLNIFIGALLDVNLYNSTNNIKDLFKLNSIILLIVLLAIQNKYKKIHPIFIITISAIIGIVFKF